MVVVGGRGSICDSGLGQSVEVVRVVALVGGDWLVSDNGWWR